MSRETKTINIYRREMTTYASTVEVSDELAEKLINDPYSKESKSILEKLCRPTDDNWMDADDAEYEIEKSHD